MKKAFKAYVVVTQDSDNTKVLTSNEFFEELPRAERELERYTQHNPGASAKVETIVDWKTTS
jgi:hypothetical protein